MLVDENDSNVLSLRGEALKCSFNSCVLGLAVHNEKVLLIVGRSSHMLLRVSMLSLDCTQGRRDIRRYQPGEDQ